MSYPVEVPAQGLYEASTTQRHALGDLGKFQVTLGGAKYNVLAKYVANNNAASIAQGFAVGHPFDNDAKPYAVDTAVYANVSAIRGGGAGVGIICASMEGTATSLGGGGYAWAAFEGPVTAAALAENVAANALLYVSINSAARLASIVTSTATASVALPNMVGRYGATASTISRASTTNVAGHFVMLFGWR